MNDPLAYLLTISSFLFVLGLFAVLTRRNIILILVGIELMLNAGNLNFIAFWRYGGVEMNLTGPLFVLFSIAIAAAEAAVGLAIILMIYRRYRTTDLNRIHTLHG